MGVTLYTKNPKYQKVLDLTYRSFKYLKNHVAQLSSRENPFVLSSDIEGKLSLKELHELHKVISSDPIERLELYAWAFPEIMPENPNFNGYARFKEMVKFCIDTRTKLFWK